MVWRREIGTFASLLAVGLGWVVEIAIRKIYDYEHFIPGGTNNLHFADIRHPFLITSRYTRLARRQAKTDHYRKSSLL
jgi:hypothetical protein